MQAPYLLFLGDVTDVLDAKTGAGIRQWRPELCAGQWRMPGCTIDLGLPDMDPARAVAKGVRTLIIGIANDGGFIAEHWIPSLIAALEAGLDVASGLHQTLASVPAIAAAAQRCGRQLIEVRQPGGFPVGTGEKRSGRRLLTVGTDCAVGKKYTALAIEKALRSRGVAADFRATGQTGIFISGRGVAIDSVVADFVSGAAEWLSPPNDPAHWDIIEGQGALFHPAYAAVTLGLIHGSQPDALVLCHDAGRAHLLGFEKFRIPDYRTCMDIYLGAARLTNPAARFVGVSINTSRLADGPAKELLRETAQATGLPCCDPIRSGVDAIADAMLQGFRT